MADWVDAFHELWALEQKFEGTSMGCRVQHPPLRKTAQEVLKVDFQVAFGSDGKPDYVTMVPKKEARDDG